MAPGVAGEHGQQLVATLQFLERDRAPRVVGRGGRRSLRSQLLPRSGCRRGHVHICGIAGWEAVTPGRAVRGGFGRALDRVTRCGGRLGGEERGLEGAVARGELLEMADPGVGGDDDPRSEHLRPPAQVQVLPHGHDHRVVAPECVEEVGPDEGDATGGDEHVPHGVVLAVIDLVGLHPLHDRAALVDAHAHVDQLHGVGPAHDLRRHDSGVRPERLFDQEVDGVGIECDVVVTQQVVGRSGDHRADLVHGRSEAPVRLEPPDVGVG